MKTSLRCLKEEWRNSDKRLQGVMNPFTCRSKDNAVMGILTVEKKKEVRTKTGLKPGGQEEEKMKVVKES